MIKRITKGLPKWLLNKYTLVLLAFLIVVLFFDSSNLINRYEQVKTVNELKNQRAFYKSEIEMLKEQQRSLANDPELLEKFAREEYWMKKDDEDLFIIVEE